MQQRKKRRGLFGTLLLTAILVTAVFAYTNSIGMPATPNIGASDVQPLGTYQVDNVAWVTDVNTNAVTGVDLTFDAALAASATVRVDAGDGSGWQNCDAPAGVNVHCTLDTTPAAVQSLTVFAEG